MGLVLREVVTDADFEAWRSVRIAVVPAERCDTVAELRRQVAPDRLLLIAERDGELAASGVADRSDAEGAGFAAPRVIPSFRRQGIGTVLLAALAGHVATLPGVSVLRGNCDDHGSVAFATAHGFTETGREIEQIRTVGAEPLPVPPPGVEIVELADRPELWAACYQDFGRPALADFAVDRPMNISAEAWARDWPGELMYLALDHGAVVGCAGLTIDTDQPSRAEHALTAVRRDWRGRGVASYLKRLTLHRAAQRGLSQVYTWTQTGNADMRRLNEHLGYVTGQQSVTMSRPV